MIDAPLLLPKAAALPWAEAVGRGLDALRLNRQYPEWERIRAHVVACARTAAADGLRVDRGSALPSPREWMRVRVEAELRSTTSAPLPGPPPEDGGMEGLLVSRHVHVALRHQHGDRASYAVRVDRLDVSTGMLARYSLILSDRPGRTVSEGELALKAAERFHRQLGLLSTQDAALAFVVLRDQEGMDVEEVVRGLVGPAALGPDHPLLGGDPGCGPTEIRRFARTGPVVTACLERASLDLTVRTVDDPLAADVVLPADHQPFGLSRTRKWAAATPDVPALAEWLRARGSRGIVVGYTP